MASPRAAIPLGLAWAALAPACTGTIDEGRSPAVPESPPPPGQAAPRACEPTTPARLWLLTDRQYEKSIRALLPGVTVPEVRTPGRSEQEFIDRAGQFAVTGVLASSYGEAAKIVAAQAAAKAPALLACAAGQAEADCVAAFIESFGARAFRRPLDAAESAALAAVFSVGRAQSLADGVRLVIEAILQAPSFVYRTELGAAGAAGAVVELTPYELASALSFFLTDAPPDEPLWQAARDGSLARPEVLAREVDRLLSLPETVGALADVFLRWTGLGAGLVAELPRDQYPQYDQALRDSLTESARLFFRDLLTAGGTVADALTSSRTFVDARLAALYGAPQPAGPGFAAVELPAGERAGVLTTGGVLAAHSGGSRIVHRGLFVRREILCDELAPPPPTLDISDPPGMPSEREKVALRRDNPACGGCHGLMDPLGLAFEQHDALGRFVPVQDGRRVDASGELRHTDVDGPVRDLADMAGRLAASPKVARCMVKHVASYALGRAVEAADPCLGDGAATAATPADLRVIDLVRHVALSPALRRRR